jgi:hypothetical protein
MMGSARIVTHPTTLSALATHCASMVSGQTARPEPIAGIVLIAGRGPWSGLGDVCYGGKTCPFLCCGYRQVSVRKQPFGSDTAGSLRLASRHGDSEADYEDWARVVPLHDDMFSG